MNYNLDKYRGIIPAFYACYDDDGQISPERTQKLVQYYIDQGVKGLYVCGSSGECIYQSMEERKITLENVMKVRGNLTIIAHVACNNTADSVELAAHADSLGVDAIASIPPIYFHLPEYAIAQYWNTISAAAPNTDFIIYNIPQLAGTALTIPLFKEMLKNPRMVGVKNSSMDVLDIERFKRIGMEQRNDFIVFNGPDEQYVSGRVIGADGGIGGTYGIMPQLFLKAEEYVATGNLSKATEVQHVIADIILNHLCKFGCMYATIKAILAYRGINVGTVRAPMPQTPPNDQERIVGISKIIDEAIARFQ